MESIVLQYGLAGVVILALSAAVRIQWKQNNDLQEKRLNDLKEVNEKTNTNVQGLTEVVNKIYDALPKNKRGK